MALTSLHRTRARETVDWLQREMVVARRLSSALDADSDGPKGGSTSGTRARFDRFWADDSLAFRRALDVRRKGTGTAVLCP